MKLWCSRRVQRCKAMPSPSPPKTCLTRNALQQFLLCSGRCSDANDKKVRKGKSGPNIKFFGGTSRRRPGGLPGPKTFTLSPKVPEGHKHRVTTPGTLGKSRGPPQNPAETPRNPRRDPAEPSERPPQSPLRGKFPRRASRRVVPLGW